MKSMIIQLVDEEIKATNNLAETAEQFVDRVSQLFIDEIQHLKMYAPLGLDVSVAEEIKQEVLDILRIRTYGHFNLRSYRLSIVSSINIRAIDNFAENCKIHGTKTTSDADSIG